MTEETRAKAIQKWSEWLNSQLEARNWKQATLVHASKGAIKRDRVSKWVNAKELPSHRMAVVVANVLGVEHEVVLEAASYDTSVVVRPSPVAVEHLSSFTSEQLASELLRRMKSDVGGAHDDEDYEVNLEDMSQKDVALAAKRGKRKVDVDHAE